MNQLWYSEKKMDIVGNFPPLFFVPGPIFSKARKGKMINLHGFSQNCLLLIIPFRFSVVG